MKIQLVLIVSLILIGCSKQEETKTVDYYLAHQDEMQTKLSECTKNPGESRGLPNCVNASAARRDKSAGTNKELSFTK
ncbi:MAG: EexN family lipoprotein [Pseudomonadota bacterium]